MIKIYPCLVIEKTKTHDWYIKGEYTPYSTEQAASLIAEVKKRIPHGSSYASATGYSARNIVAGVKKSNLRHLCNKNFLIKAKNVGVSVAGK